MGPTGCLPLLLSRIFFKSFFAIVGQFWWIFWRLDSKNGFNFCRVDYLSDNTILWSTLYFCLLPHREPLHRVSWQCRKRLGATLASYRASFLSLVLLNHINQDKKEKKKTSGLLGDLFVAPMVQIMHRSRLEVVPRYFNTTAEHSLQWIQYPREAR